MSINVTAESKAWQFKNIELKLFAVSNWDSDPARGGDIVSQILNEGEDVGIWGESELMRITTTYWKTQRKIGHLTRVKIDGEIIQEVVDENYKITEKPVYDTTIFKQKSKNIS